MSENHERVQLFDDWAKEYDQAVKDFSDFPFGGYEQVLEEMIRSSGLSAGQSVLDLGTGTGNLALKFANQGCRVWGSDFSAEMLAIACSKAPQVTFIQADLLTEWPGNLPDRFNIISAAYVLHEFRLETKIRLLALLVGHLENNGRLLVGDISFPDETVRELGHAHWKGSWDEDEYYWAADETEQACQKIGLAVQYKQISPCAGVYAFRLK